MDTALEESNLILETLNLLRPFTDLLSPAERADLATQREKVAALAFDQIATRTEALVGPP